MQQLTEYIPIITTIFSVFFTVEIYQHYKKRKTKYLLWWTIGVITFGLGTFAESVNILYGWSEFNLRYWYIVGALLGGFPLAQGSVYLLMNRKFANLSTIVILTVIVVGSICVMITPLTIPEGFDNKLTGTVFSWQWVRYFSPLVNIYAFLFLVGGAIYSAIRYYNLGQKDAAFKGNIFIAIGGLLPGIGGSFTRMGYVEVLFVTELLGLLLIYYGYRVIKNDRRVQPIHSKG